MTDLDALRRAVLADPADDTVRLAYADALEENGDRDRAEFVRVGVELFATADPHGDRFWDGQLGDGPESYQRRKALRRRERELLRLHEATWRQGRRCGRCEGDGRTWVGDGPYPGDDRKYTCPACHGIGWLGSLADRCLTNNPRRVADIGGTVIYETTEWRDGWLIPAEWSRGFVSGVRVTLDQLTREWNGHPWAAYLFR